MAWSYARALVVLTLIGAPVFACSSASETSSTSGGGSSATSTTTTGMGGAGATTTTTATSSTGAGAHAPIMCSDAYSDIPKGECDLLQQDCAAGMTCRPVTSNGDYTTKCVESSGLKTITKPCTSNNECAAGLFCVFNQCSPPCCPDNDQPCNGGSCNVNQAYGDRFAMFCSFLQQCELLTENACPDGTDCYLQDPKQGLAACVPPSANQVDEGGNCQFLNDCQSMQFCYAKDANSPAVCRWHCHPSDKNMSPPGLGGCPQGETCQAFNFGLPDLGLCLPPP